MVGAIFCALNYFVSSFNMGTLVRLMRCNMSNKFNYDEKEFDRVVADFFDGYKDRGMLQWQGFFLSDHTSRLKKARERESYVEERRPSESMEEISTKLFKSFKQRTNVNVQLNERDNNGRYSESLNGFVKGYTGDIVLIGNDRVNINLISSVEFL